MPQDGEPRPEAVLQVAVFCDGELVTTDLFSSGEITVGRDPATADLLLESNQVSRNHASIHFDGTQIKVRDADSTNGIFVNDERSVEALISPKDEVKIGDFVLRFKIEAAKRSHTPTPLGDDELSGTDPMSEGEGEQLPTPEDDNAPIDSEQFGVMLEQMGIAGQERARRKSSRDPTDSNTAIVDRKRITLPTGDDDAAADDYEPPYSLATRLMEETPDLIKKNDEPTSIEVLTIVGDSVQDVRFLRPGLSFNVGRQSGLLSRLLRRSDEYGRRRIFKVGRDGRCRVELHRQQRGLLQRDGKQENLLESPRLQRNDRRHTSIVSLELGEAATVVDEGVRYVARYTQPPARMEDYRTWAERFSPDALTNKAVVASAVFHVTLFAVLALTLPTPEQEIPPKHSAILVSFDHPEGKRPDTTGSPAMRQPGRIPGGSEGFRIFPMVLGRGGQVETLSKPTALAKLLDAPAAHEAVGGVAVIGVANEAGQGLRVHGDAATDPKDMMFVVNDEMSRIEQCYQATLKTDSSVEGVLEFSWTVTRGGDVQEASLTKDTVGSTQLTSCVTARLQRLRFPPQPGDVQVSLPIQFARLYARTAR